MARKYANVLTAIWRDADFRALPATAQRTYMMLFSQPDISAAGTLPLTVGRWSRFAVDTKPDDLRADFATLERARFLVVDEETEELLVRTFIAWDGGANNPKRQPVIRSACEAVASTRIRAALAGVLKRLTFPEEYRPDWYADSLSAWESGALSSPYSGVESHPAQPTSEASDCDGRHTSTTAVFPQVDSLSGRQPRLDRVVVTEVSRDTSTHNPETTTHNPQTANRAERAPSRPARAHLAVADDDPDFSNFWRTYPRRDAKGAAREAWPKAVAKAGNPHLVIQGAARYRDWSGRDDRYTKLPATWLNQECWNDELAARAGNNGSGYRPYRDGNSTRDDYLGDL